MIPGDLADPGAGTPPADQLLLPWFVGMVEQLVEELPISHPERLVPIGTGTTKLFDRYLLQRRPEGCLYLHEWFASDPDDPHNHPWDSTTFVLRTGFFEIVGARDGSKRRTWCPPGTVIFRRAEDWHRVELDLSLPERPLSLFITGPERQPWGFDTEEGFVVGREYRSVEAFRRRRSLAAPAR